MSDPIVIGRKAVVLGAGVMGAQIAADLIDARVPGPTVIACRPGYLGFPSMRRAPGSCSSQVVLADSGSVMMIFGTRVGGCMSKRLPAICSRIDVGVLLDAFVRSRHYVPHDARRIRSREDLPVALQSHTRQVDSVVWRAWSDGSRIWFVKAKLVSCEDAAGLQIMFLDVDGHLDSSGMWIWLQDRQLLRASA